MKRDAAADPSPVPALGPTESVSLLRSRSRRRVRIVKLSSIRWFRAAGNYSEAVTHEGVILLDDSLAILSRRLPPETFARVHRTAIVRLASIKEVRSRGHGDADLFLECGGVVRMSRRYRSGLAGFLGSR